MPQQAHAPRTVCPDLEGAGKSFTGIVQGGMISSWTLFWMADVEVIRSQHHPPSGFDWSGVPGPVGRIQLLLPPSGGFSTCKTTQLYCSYSYPLRGTRTRAQGRTVLSWLLPPFLCNFSLPCLGTIQTCPSEGPDTGKVLEAEWSPFPVVKKWGTQEGLCAQEPLGVLLSTLWCYTGQAQSLHKVPIPLAQ